MEHELLFEVPLSVLHFDSNPKTRKTQAKVSLLALFHDSEGEVVAKVGRELTRELQSSQAAQVPKESIFYAEPVDLLPGHYTVDTAVTDEQTGQTSVKRLAFFVSPTREFGLSSLELLKEGEPAAPTANSVIPVRDIVPTLSDSVTTGTPVDIYFAVYPSKLKPNDPPKVVLQVLRDGKEIARKPLKQPQPEPDGSVPVRLRLSPEPGQCDIFITAQQGSLLVQSSLSVKVQ